MRPLLKSELLLQCEAGSPNILLKTSDIILKLCQSINLDVLNQNQLPVFPPFQKRLCYLEQQ